MAYSTWNNLFDDLLTDFPVLFRDDFNKMQTPQKVPVNVTEMERAYKLEVIAPGYEKSDFKVTLDKDVLTISAENKETNKEQKEKLIRKEYLVKSFKRSFTIDQRIDAKEIDAQYVNGVLTVQLPKKQEEKKITAEISIK
jgi:HSP20 family protein